MDLQTCSVCGTAMFVSMPGQTTSEEIRVFASQMLKTDLSRLREWEEVINKGWLHAGVYCPNGCSQILFDLRPADFWDEFETRKAQVMPEQEQAVIEEAYLRQIEKARTPWGDTVCGGCGERLSTWADSERWRCGYCQRSLNVVPIPEPMHQPFPWPVVRHHTHWETGWEALLTEELQTDSARKIPPMLLDMVVLLRKKTGASWLSLYNFTKDYYKRHDMPFVPSPKVQADE